ncbi:MAG: recombination mediator RecR [Clostridiales bacterium]|nr:recombination protein RecR [Clostridia bacterium]MCR5353082.1 recombination mediator RecR [Clostridiales bacterium]
MSENNFFASPLENLASKFRSLPGIGKKTAYRLAFAVIDFPEQKALDFANAIIEAKKKISKCSVCGNISDSGICPVCADKKRNKKLICVVEDPRDVAAIMKISEYEGVFHVLGGLLSPLDGKTPEKLNIKSLLSRTDELLKTENPKDIEIIIATNPSVEGDATAMYLSRLIKNFGIKVTRLAYGIPVGGDLEYADEVTLERALSGRNEI